MTFWRNRNQRRLEEARAAREKAEQALELTKAQTRAFEELADSLRDLRERNHFGAAIAEAFRKGGSK